jgi:glycosyltransferase involved in cell wall biosynthesis
LKLSILIKTLNEGKRIKACVTSAQSAALELGVPFEIVVADSRSDDDTVEQALSLGANVIRLKQVADRSCGTGAQLGMQVARGEFIYLLDGDMRLEPGFLRAALDELQRRPEVGGVGGILKDTRHSNWFDQYRSTARPSAVAGEVKGLSGGGLYRRTALEAAGGYAANRNLAAFEESELGMRLRSAGYRLIRLGIPAILHEGHAVSTWGVIRRMWVSGRFRAFGVLLRQSLGKPWLGDAMALVKQPLAILLTWVAAALLTPWLGWQVGLGLLALYLALLVALVVKKKNVTSASFSLVLWNISALGLLAGLLARGLHKPGSPIDAEVLHPCHASVTGGSDSPTLVNIDQRI